MKLSILFSFLTMFCSDIVICAQLNRQLEEEDWIQVTTPGVNNTSQERLAIMPFTTQPQPLPINHSEISIGLASRSPSDGALSSYSFRQEPTVAEQPSLPPQQNTMMIEPSISSHTPTADTRLKRFLGAFFCCARHPKKED